MFATPVKVKAEKVGGRLASSTASKVHSMEPQQSSTGGTVESSDQGGNWLFPALLAVLLVVVIGIAQLLGLQSDGTTSEKPDTAVWTPSTPPTGETVSLAIDYGNGASKVFAALPWKAEMTVADLMQAASQFRPGIRFTQQGSGASGFLTSLEGVENQGASGRNWIYQIGEKHAHQSFCLEKIEPGMHILWTFTDQQYNAKPAEE